MASITATVNRPAETEYAPFYAGYIQRVQDEDIFGLFGRQFEVLNILIGKLSPEQADFRPGPAEWNIKEIVGHLIDAERVWAYRVLRISRTDQTPLPGFDQDDYVRESNFSSRTLPDLLEEFDLSRRANILAFNRLPTETLSRQGIASNAAISVRALLYMMAGHVEHHLESLREVYLPKLNR